MNPSFKVDWRKMDLGDVLTIIGMFTTVTAGYYDLRTDIRTNEAKTQERFAAVKAQFEAQQKIDQDQNDRMVRNYDNLQRTVKEVKDDIRSDIKDLKTDIAVRAAALAARAPR